jgi:hypothetical protein
MTTTYTFARDVTPKDWSALPRAFAKGETVTRFRGHTYGLDRDDMMLGGFETIPCLADGREGFFTVPVEMLLTEDGKRPMGDYVRLPASL